MGILEILTSLFSKKHIAPVVSNCSDNTMKTNKSCSSNAKKSPP